jgi:hypothetical protein
VFGIIRPCRHRLGGELGAAWQAHLCGMCLSLRDDHGQAARLATNYDGLVISVLVEAQVLAAAKIRDHADDGDGALLGIRLALAEAEFTDTRLLHALLVHELARSVHRVFAGAAGLASGLSGLPSLRHGRGCCASRCCGCGEDCCVDCTCEGCCDGCDCTC